MPASHKTVPPVPFRHFLNFAEMQKILHDLAASRPNLARLQSIGKSRDGRDLHCITITDFSTGAPEDKPAYLIYGNMHAPELSGTHAALYTARQLLADYPRKTRILERVAFHIVPRINPDGAEAVVTTSMVVRSRNDYTDPGPNTIAPKDMNGDGLILQMRIKHPDGNRATHPKDKRLLVNRKADSKGPFYKVFTEGEIHNWDGSLDIRNGWRSIDWNRQWPYDWQPEPGQAGAGDFPLSEMEMHHLAEFISARPNLFGLLSYHTGPAALLRPPSAGSDNDIDAGDLAKMKDLCREGTRLTGLDATPVTEYPRKEPPHLNLRGHFPSTGYHHLGLFVFEFELGTIWNSAGITWKEFSSWKGLGRRHDELWIRVLKWWDRNGRKPKIFVPWKRFDHPQLGPVEIGGRVLREWAGMTLPDLKKRSAGTYKFTLHHAEQHPRLDLEDVAVDSVAKDVYRLRARVANRGHLPTHISNRGAKLSRLRPVRVQFTPSRGVELLSQRGHIEVGHLAGSNGSRYLEWFVRGRAGRKCTIEVRGGTGGNTRVTVTL